MGRMPGRLPQVDYLAPVANLPLAISLGLAFVGWWTAFIGQAIAESRSDGSRSLVGVQWFNMYVALSSCFSQSAQESRGLQSRAFD